MFKKLKLLNVFFLHLLDLTIPYKAFHNAFKINL